MMDDVDFISHSIGFILGVFILRYLFHDTLVDSFIISVLGLLLVMIFKKIIDNIITDKNMINTRK